MQEKTMFKKKEFQKIEINADVEVGNLVQEEVREAIDVVIKEASKKYFRNITVEFAIDIK